MSGLTALSTMRRSDPRWPSAYALYVLHSSQHHLIIIIYSIYSQPLQPLYHIPGAQEQRKQIEYFIRLPNTTHTPRLYLRIYDNKILENLHKNTTIQHILYTICRYISSLFLYFIWFRYTAAAEGYQMKTALRLYPKEINALN